ncbi:energy transducer TonB [Pseudomonas agarici]|uniref:energy transducer TonB n=1 Tax=Pseudomonas agarici TaxID=46677 RepID=UPI0015A415C3|nr:energy transducer TonB [Pseudomonas agarici]NWB89725.1 energy transducer TonB [Pseudomonas agarici]
MSDFQRTSIGYLSPVGDYGLRNSQALSGVSHLWQDFFVRAMAEQVGDAPEQAAVDLPVDGPVEPTAGAKMLAQIVDQRHCDVTETPIRPPEPLFLPIAEFALDLLKKPAPPYPDDEIVAQQHQQDFDNGWVRPLVLSAGQPLPNPGVAPRPRPLHLPIAEFELDLLEKPPVPFDEQTLARQQQAMDYDLLWARPLVAHNLRLAA